MTTYVGKSLLLATAAVGLSVIVGCSGAVTGARPGAVPASPSPSSVSPASSAGGTRPVRPAQGAPAAAGSPSAGNSAQVAASITAAVRAQVRPSASRFYTATRARDFASSWGMLAPAARRAIPLRVWVAVHEACPPGDGTRRRIIKSVTIFGDAAIVTTTINGVPAKLVTDEDAFSFADGRWGFFPQDLGLYQHKSVAADVAAARAAGLCQGWKSF